MEQIDGPKLSFGETKNSFLRFVADHVRNTDALELCIEENELFFYVSHSNSCSSWIYFY